MAGFARSHPPASPGRELADHSGAAGALLVLCHVSHLGYLQGTRGEESNVLGNGHGSGPSLVELGMALERPASSASTGSGTQKAAACPAAPGAQGPAMTQRSPKAGGATLYRPYYPHATVYCVYENLQKWLYANAPDR